LDFILGRRWRLASRIAALAVLARPERNRP
jgi:hypothetical protein